MSLSVHDSPGIRRIELLGMLEDEGEFHRLCRALRDRPGLRVELSIYDLHTIDGDLIEVLAERVLTGSALRINAYHPSLARQLLRLGLPAMEVRGHSITPSPPLPQAVVIGGSANSLDKILLLIEQLPRSAATLFVVQHIMEDRDNLLDRLLRVRTGYSVVMPRHLMPVEPSTIYIAPPGHQMRVAHGLVYLTRDRAVNHARPSIDLLFESVAWEFGERALALLLCGFGSDGVASLQTLCERGATVLVEEGDECREARVLPDQAAASGSLHHRLHVEEMSAYLAATLCGRDRILPPEPLVELLLNALNVRYGYDFRGYQRSTLERQLQRLAQQLALGDFFAIVRELLSGPESFERLFIEMSINVTSFYRHPQQFRLLREQVLPYLDTFPRIKIWSAGCSSGEEVYTLALLLDELGMLEKSQIYATDINHHVLTQARNGLYPRESLAESLQNEREAGGSGLRGALSDNGLYLEIAPRLRERILFHRHSLVHDGEFNEFQLIICRNVLIYFNSALQWRVMDLFSRSLHRDGFLLLGPSEGLSGGEGGRHFAAGNESMRLYRWRRSPALTGLEPDGERGRHA